MYYSARLGHSIIFVLCVFAQWDYSQYGMYLSDGEYILSEEGRWLLCSENVKSGRREMTSESRASGPGVDGFYVLIADFGDGG